MKMKVESHDSRYVLLECSDKYRGQTPFFDNLVDNVFTQEAGDMFFSYCYHFSEGVHVRDSPCTAFKQEAIVSSMSSPLRFLYFVKELLDEVKENTDSIEVHVPGSWRYVILNADDGYVLGRDFFHCYNLWCTEERERVFSNVAFGRDLKGYIEKKRSARGYIYFLSTIQF